MSWQNAAKLVAVGAVGIGGVAMMTYFSEYGFVALARAAGETTTSQPVTAAMPPAATAASDLPDGHITRIRV
jgi:hypothetical protein